MLRDLKLRTVQRNIDESNNIAVNFLIPALRESTAYDRSTGFFSINVLLELFEGLLPFIRNNGKIRCVTSIEVQEKDFDFFSEALDRKVNIMKDKLEDIIDSSLSLSEEELDKLDILTNLMAIGRLEFRFVCLDKGMYHEKIGFLQDGTGDTIYFTGSANESTYGAIFNRESVHLTFSWKDIDDDMTIQSERSYFEKLWNSHDENVDVFTFPEAVKNKLFKKYKVSETLEQACMKYERQEKGDNVTKSGKTIRPYQEKAINLFVENDGHAFFEMATGTGKTFTAINAIKRFIEKKDSKFLVLILVPLVDLQNQWAAVLESEGISPYFVGGNGDTSDVNDIINDFLTFDESQYAVCVYRSFFLKMAQIVSSIKTTKNIILVVDEAHNLSVNNMKLMPINTPYRLGLSATPERYNPVETEKLMNYFLRPGETTFKYGLEDAIKAGYLAHYDYYPICIHMTDDEMERYNQFAQKIAALASKKKRTQEEDDKLTTYLNMRSQIVKHAEGKFDLLSDMVNSGAYDFSNSVIYCGRGGNILNSEDDSEKSIERVIRILSNDSNLMVSSFIDNTPNRKDVLRSFEEGIITTLVAIKCLDEGVDIPSLERLYVLASDGAERQTIQRRGRVLRICKETGKDKASIYDIVALPPLDVVCEGQALVITELSRVKAYASLADNFEELDIQIRKLEDKYNIQEEDYKSCREEILN